jgi:hypothetical protein
MLRRDGRPNGAKESDQLSGDCRFPQGAAPPGYGEGKILYLLPFLAMAGRAHFSISRG